MAEIILAAHGKMATEVKRSAEMISGEQPRVHTTEFLQGEGIEQVKEKLEACRKTIPGNEILILVDLFGGTPYNASCAFVMEHQNDGTNYQVVSGLSLPLLLQAVMADEAETAEVLAAEIIETAAETVKRFSSEDIEEEEEL